MARTIKIDNAILKKANKKDKKATTRKFCNILIVCEGAKTEPNYFRAFNNNKLEDLVIDLRIEGTGDNTMYVVNKAIKFRDDSPNIFDAVWAVFDKDSFPDRDFNSAILKAKTNGIQVAWSNEAFELWYLYHFVNRTTPMTRDQYKAAISNAVNKKITADKSYAYAKNATNNYANMTKYGDQSQAIIWAEAQHKQFHDEKFATHNPCTTVYQLVRQLIGEDKGFIDKVMESINKP